MQRPVVRLSIGDPTIIVDALVDSGSEHVLADSSLAIAAGISLDNPIDVEQIGIGGGFVEARFVEVVAHLHPPAPDRRSSTWVASSWALLSNSIG